MSESNITINVKLCLDCGKCEGEVKFQKYIKYCTKCNSKRSNEIIKNKNPDYFKNIMKCRYTATGQKVGRPRKNNIEII
jgi:Zn finger protein HypA/HybF involved in hydrogenase expression